MESLQDRVVVITGASAGIGRATARELIGAGARVALGARRRERLEAIEGFRMGGGAISGGGSGMFRFVIRRVLISLPVLLLASIIVFLVIRTSFDPFA